MDLRERIAAAFHARGRTLHADILDELAAHAENVFESARRRGLLDEQCLAAVDREIVQWVQHAAELTRKRLQAGAPVQPAADPPTGSWVSRSLVAALDDARYAARMLARRPGETAVAGSTIALGVAAVTLLASIVWSVLLKPLPWPDADRLVRIYETREGGTSRFGQFGPIVTNGAYLAWSDHPGTIEAIAAWQPGERTLTGTGPAERLQLAASTASLPDVLRVRPFLGRWFDESEQDAGAPVVVLAYGFWRDRLAARPDIAGDSLRLDGVPHTVLGVMPPEFGFPDRETRAWVPLPVPTVIDPASRSGRLRMFSAMARLRPGMTAAQAAAEATARTRATPTERALGIAIFGSSGPAQVLVVPALDDEIRHVRPALVSLLAAVLLLLVTSAGNVANVQLARAIGRRRELAIRGALGAPGGRLGRQVLFETLILTLVGGLVGVLLGSAGLLAVPLVLPADFPRVDEIAINWPAVAVALAASATAGVATGLVPALHARRLDVAGTLAENSLAVAGGGRRIRLARAVVMTVQVGAAVVLLVGATLLARSFIALLDTDRGFDVAHVLTAELPLTPAENTVERRSILLREVIDRLASVPGVTAAGFTSILPLTDSESIRAFEMPDRRRDGSIVTARTNFRVVSPRYFQAMGMRVTMGRGLTDDDTAQAKAVIIVNRSFARTYLDDTPLGEHLPLTDSDWEVVGIVDDVRGADGRSASPELYVSYRQWSGPPGGNPMLVVRTAGDPVELGGVLRGLIRELDPALALGDIRTLEDRLGEQLARPRLYSFVMAAFAALALAIAGVGLFAVLSFTVAHRSRELAVRTTMGATPLRVVSLVVRQALALTAAGLVIGFVASAMLGRVISAYLFGVSSRDPATFAMVALVLSGVTGLACAVPAIRAARVDPAVILREE